MEKQSFESFLQKFHDHCYPQILDDDLLDHFDGWLAELDADTLIEMGNLYGRQQELAGRDYVLDRLSNKRKE